MDTLDGEPLFRGYILPPKNAIQVCCINDKARTGANHWFIMSHYHPLHSVDIPPVGDIKVFDGDIPVYNNTYVEAGTVLTFDGRGSYDENNDPIDKFIWTIFIDGEEFGVMSQSVFPIDTIRFAGQTLGVSLVVSANNAFSVPVDFDCYIETANSPPIAHFTVDPYVVVGVEVPLDATGSSDPDGDNIEAYVWTFASQPQGSYINLDDLSAATGTFTPDVEGVYEISLVVNDGQLDSVAVINNTFATPNYAPIVTVLGDNPCILIQTLEYGEYGEAEDNLHGLPNYDMGAYAIDPEGDSFNITISGGQ